MDDAEGNRDASKQYSQEIHETGPNHSLPWFQRSSVDHGCHGVRRVVKAIDKLESESSGKTQKQQGQRSGSDRTIQKTHSGASLFWVECQTCFWDFLLTQQQNRF